MSETFHAEASTSGEQASIPIAPSSAGRVSGKPWKLQKAATVLSHLPEGVKTKWEERMQKTQKEKAIKKLQTELKEEKEAEKQRRREITLERKKAAEERRRLEEEKAKMGARKAARLRRKAGRTKKINH
ncbi:similar to rRNA-processing protein cgrA [Phanerochaete sordida]|uniref:rRNA-processing protein n=1 Tax=Phanerochaete sordida TaxID=48140 RepID=A0A9P3L855_9APHY|nr:similar to rRNA-processing protein cgrA [Phanerochaete sordida]